MDLLTIDETAAMIRRPVNTLRYWRHEGTGPKSARIGRRVMYRRADVTAWIEAQYEDAPGGAA